MPGDDQKALLDRIALLEELASKANPRNAGPAIRAAIGVRRLLQMVYGPNSGLERSLVAIVHEQARIPLQTAHVQYTNRALIEHVQGTIETLRGELQAGLLGNIRRQLSGEVLADFVGLGRDALERGSKDVAAVLASAALEDGLKRLAEEQGLDVDAANITEVVNALKSQQRLTKIEGKLILDYKDLRDQAMHANWVNVNINDVRSLIGFTEEFLLRRFG